MVEAVRLSGQINRAALPGRDPRLWLRCQQGRMATLAWPDLVGLNHPTFYAMTGSTAGWSQPAQQRPGGNGWLRFDGTGYLQIPDAPALRMTGDMTIAFWICPVNVSSVVVGSQKGTDGSAEVTYGWGWNTDGKMAFTHFNGFYGTSNYVMQANVPVHVLMARTTANTTITYYVNGVSQGGFTYSQGPVSNTHSLGIGTRGNNDNVHLLLGALDDYQMWGSALTAGEAWQVYQLSLGGWPGVLPRSPGAKVVMAGAPSAVLPVLPSRWARAEPPPPFPGASLAAVGQPFVSTPTPPGCLAWAEPPPPFPGGAAAWHAPIAAGNVGAMSAYAWHGKFRASGGDLANGLYRR